MISAFKNINQFAGKSKLLDSSAIFFARYLIYILLFFLLIFAYFFRNWQIFLYPLFSGLIGAFIINKIIYIFYKKLRPAALEGVKVLIPVPKNPSFPSRHTAFLFGISFFLFFYNVPLAIVFIICSCFVGLARVFCGVHWFVDILAGILVGFLSSVAIYYLFVNIKL